MGGLLPPQPTEREADRGDAAREGESARYEKAQRFLNTAAMNVLTETRPIDGEVSPRRARAAKAAKDGSTARVRTDWAPEVNGHLQRSNGSALADWENAIQQCYARGTTHTLALARIVFAARSALPFGEWTHLGTSPCRPFSKRKAEMLVV